MSLRNFRTSGLIAFAGIAAAASFVVAQQTRTSKPAADFKVTYKVTMPGGMQQESTTMIKGARERSEQHMGYGFDTVSLTQCDLRRTIQLSDKTKKYVINPMESGDSDAAPATSAPTSGPSRRGGVITSVITSTESGERKEMFGFTARHVKTTIKMESSPDACSPTQMHMEQDGWYIDLNVGLNCETGRPPIVGRPAMGGCQDRFRSRHIGTGRTGFPLVETTIGYGPNGQEQYRMTKEVVDLSRQSLDATLFDIPAGYTEASSTQELYAVNQADMMAEVLKGQSQSMPNANAEAAATMAPETKRAGVIRVGVVQINNKTDRSVSTESLRERLIEGLHGANGSGASQRLILF